LNLKRLKRKIQYSRLLIHGFVPEYVLEHILKF
jgi:hypothetical protein